jgi:serine/threonine protein kinase
MSLAPGIKLGHYEIVAPLGAGGMGEVYRARDTVLKREVAIKILPDSYSSDPERLRRFQQEAEAAATLNHPNILTVHQVGRQDSISYIVTELLQGETLREELQRGPLPVRTAIDYAVQIARGLDTAHENGIVHRDLKPENFFITKDGRVKILDFGLAKLTQPQLDPLASTQAVANDTTPGAVMGTVGYMSPEQVRGQPADPRSDIFAFGAVLFEMLTGKRPFQGTTYADTVSAVLHQDPPISEMTANQPPGLQRIISRCLQKNREQRFHSAADLAFAIEALSDTPSGIQTTSPVRNSPLLGWVKWGVAAALVLAAVSIGWYRHKSSSPTGAGISVLPLEIRALTENGKVARAAASPDGRYVAYVKRDAGQRELRLLQVATERDVQVLSGSPNRINSLHFSPDGNFIYLVRQLNPGDQKALGVYRVATLGGPVTPLATDAKRGSVTVSPDGKQIAYIAETQSESQIVAVDPDGANRRILARRPLGVGFLFVEWSPLPDTLAAVAIGKEDIGLVSVELPSGSIRELSMSGWGGVGQPAWSPDGATIFSPSWNGITTQIWAFDAHTGAHRALTSGATDYSEWSLSGTATGDLIAASDTVATTLWVADQPAQPHPIAALRGEGSDSVVWVNGRVVTSNITEMMVHDVEGRNPTKLRSHSLIYRELARCGPGMVAYWAADDKVRTQIERIDVVTGSTTKLTDGPEDSQPSCTADGATLVYVRCVDLSRCFITRKSVDSEKSFDLCEVPEHDNSWPALSPDGTKVIFLRRPDAKGPYEWEIVPLSGGSPQKLNIQVPIADASNYAWSPDGKSILYVHEENGAGNIWSAPLDGKAPRKLTAFDSELVFAFDVSPDNRLAISRGSHVNDVVLIKNAR